MVADVDDHARVHEKLLTTTWRDGRKKVSMYTRDHGLLFGEYFKMIFFRLGSEDEFTNK